MVGKVIQVEPTHNKPKTTMKVRVLGCSGGIAKDCRTTSFLIDHDLLVDAGTGVGDLTLDEMTAIDHVLLTHSHLDHITSLPLIIDGIAARRVKPIQIHALQATIDALKTHIFNNIIWPDFSRIPTPSAPFISFHPLVTGQTLELANKQIEVLSAVHTVPAVGYAVTRANSGKANWIFTGDTSHNPALWHRLNQMDIAMLVIETAFSNDDAELAKRSMHLSPQTVALELDYIQSGHDKSYPIYFTHLKPAQHSLIMAEIHALQQVGRLQSQNHSLHWLEAGQIFELD